MKINNAYFHLVIFREASLSDSLEGVDISVHCDIKIFGWLMQYVSTEKIVIICKIKTFQPHYFAF